jgi:hypothetical protein
MRNIEKHYLLTKSIFANNYEKIIQDLDKSGYKKSLKAIIRQENKVEKLVNGLIAISDTEDSFYSVQALMRIIIEHFLVGHYIWTKTRITKNDDAGKEYYVHYDTSEFFKRENYELRIEGIKLNKKKHNSFQNILTKYPQLHDVDETQLSEIHKIAKQFDVRDIFEYFINEKPKDGFSNFHNLMLSALSDYNYLSSYVHGGPYAELQTYEDRPYTNKQLRIMDCIKDAKMYSRTLKEHVLFLLMEDNKEYIKILEPIFSQEKE